MRKRNKEASRSEEEGEGKKRKDETLDHNAYVL
jgi:hypothetical protein